MTNILSCKAKEEVEEKKVHKLPVVGFDFGFVVFKGCVNGQVDRRHSLARIILVDETGRVGNVVASREPL